CQGWRTSGEHPSPAPWIRWTLLMSIPVDDGGCGAGAPSVERFHIVACARECMWSRRVCIDQWVAHMCKAEERTVSNEASQRLVGVIYALRYQGGGSDKVWAGAVVESGDQALFASC